jgi:hypothetical protein
MSITKIATASGIRLTRSECRWKAGNWSAVGRSKAGGGIASSVAYAHIGHHATNVTGHCGWRSHVNVRAPTTDGVRDAVFGAVTSYERGFAVRLGCTLALIEIRRRETTYLVWAANDAGAAWHRLIGRVRVVVGHFRQNVVATG